MPPPDKRPIINCHTHIFTGDHVPPFLARTYLPFGLWILLPVSVVVGFFRWWNSCIVPLRYSFFYKKLIWFRTCIAQVFIWLEPFSSILKLYTTIAVLLYINHIVSVTYPSASVEKVSYIYDTLISIPLIPVFTSTAIEIAAVLVLLLVFPTIRNWVLLLARIFWKALASLLGKETKQLFQRYINIGRYAFHRRQSTILGKLMAQYPHGSGVLVLSMDMEYMGAFHPPVRYRDQMDELVRLKIQSRYQNRIFPFIFIDPRRVVPVKEEKRAKKGDLDFLKYTAEEGKITLDKECFVSYLIGKEFSGFKIYPALGYYPFDEKLLPLWKWAADNEFPIMTHCIRGTIFYRGPKKNEWNKHPVFQQAAGIQKTTQVVVSQGKSDQEDWNNFRERDNNIKAQEAVTIYDNIVLPQMNNVDFSANFTHPMNFLCLLHEPSLRIVVGNALSKNNNKELAQIFGYTDESTPLKYDLSNLKICLGHFGGDDEWLRYFEKDRYNFSGQLIKDPASGIDFFNTLGGKPSKGKPEQIWKYTDWYSIICSMMLQYPNVYADISYILHSDVQILPLLKQTLDNPGLRTKVLYGTDFFVVRNHKSDKNMLADFQGGLSEDDFNQIAKQNPRIFLTNKLQGAPVI